VKNTEILEQRRKARSAQSLVDAALVALHRHAVKALLDPSQGEPTRRTALLQVAKWERDRLCNPRYVTAWRSILALPASSLPAAILGDDVESKSLRQNSPFGFLAAGNEK
jgi:hypothetical protein